MVNYNHRKFQSICQVYTDVLGTQSISKAEYSHSLSHFDREFPAKEKSKMREIIFGEEEVVWGPE